MTSVVQFQHQQAAHCESGVASSMLQHYGVQGMSESMAFGLAAALTFAYLPFIKLSGLPLVSYRTPPGSIIKRLLAPLDARLSFETFATAQAGMQRLNALLDTGQIVGLQTSVYWLPYFPPDMRFHFNAHNLLVYGREGDDYLISDPVFEQPQRCAAADLARARFAKGVLAPKGMLYYPRSVGRHDIAPESLRRAIGKTARGMLVPVPLLGVRGMRTLAARLGKLPVHDPRSLDFVGHLVRMQEEIGTGGAGFRFIYAAFLQEAAEYLAQPALGEFAQRLTMIGDGWRLFALRAARMVKGREPLDPPALAQLLRAQAGQEEAFFRDLRRVAVEKV